MSSYSDFKRGDVRILVLWNSEGPRPDYADYCSMHTLSGLNLITPETWADFWVRVRPVADQAAVRSALCLLLVGSAILLTAAAVLLDDSDPNWIFVWILLAVLFCMLMLWSWGKSMSRDKQIQKICKEFSTRFEADGFSVDYCDESSPWGDVKYIQFRRILL